MLFISSSMFPSCGDALSSLYRSLTRQRYNDWRSDDEKVNTRKDSVDSSLSELSDIGIDDNFQPTKPPSVMDPMCISGDLHAQVRLRSSNDQRRNKRAGDEAHVTPVSARFRVFIEDRLQMPYLVDKFASQNYDDIRMIEYFDDAMLKDEIGIKNMIHRKLFLQQCADFTKEMAQFKRWLIHRVQLPRYSHVFESAGLITMADITREIKASSDWASKLKIVNRAHQQTLWRELCAYESANDDRDYVGAIGNDAHYGHGMGLGSGDDSKSSTSAHSSNNSPQTSRPATPRRASPLVSTPTLSAYATIQRNKQIFNVMNDNNKRKQDTERRERAKENSLETVLVREGGVGLDAIGDDKEVVVVQPVWKRKRSLSTSSEPATPVTSAPVDKTTAKKEDKMTVLRPKKKRRRRKSFTLGVK